MQTGFPIETMVMVLSLMVLPIMLFLWDALACFQCLIFNLIRVPYMVLICHSFHFHTAGEKAERKYNKSIRKSEGKVRKLIRTSVPRWLIQFVRSSSTSERNADPSSPCSWTSVSCYEDGFPPKYEIPGCVLMAASNTFKQNSLTVKFVLFFLLRRIPWTRSSKAHLLSIFLCLENSSKMVCSDCVACIFL